MPDQDQVPPQLHPNEFLPPLPSPIPNPYLPMFAPDELLEVLKESYPEHTKHTHVGGGHFTTENAKGQVCVVSNEVAVKHALKLMG